MQALLLRLATRLPSPARALVTRQRVTLLVEFAKFGLVGCVGFAVDTAVV